VAGASGRELSATSSSHSTASDEKAGNVPYTGVIGPDSSPLRNGDSLSILLSYANLYNRVSIGERQKVPWAFRIPAFKA
jgi:hypothetical protein